MFYGVLVGLGGAGVDESTYNATPHSSIFNVSPTRCTPGGLKKS